QIAFVQFVATPGDFEILPPSYVYAQYFEQVEDGKNGKEVVPMRLQSGRNYIADVLSSAPFLQNIGFSYLSNTTPRSPRTCPPPLQFCRRIKATLRFLCHIFCSAV